MLRHKHIRSDITDRQKMHVHVNERLNKCASLLYAMKTLRYRGMSKKDVQNLFSTLILSRLLYACPAWWGFASASDKERLIAFSKRAARFGYSKLDKSDVRTAAKKAQKPCLNKSNVMKTMSYNT